jgi:hypothetical protein
MTNETDVDDRTEKSDTEAAAQKLASVSLGASDDEDTNREDNKSPPIGTDKGQAMEFQESLTSKQQELSPSGPSEDPLQLYPPGRILHWLHYQLQSQPQVSKVARRKLSPYMRHLGHLYSKIRLGKSMVGEHYMPKYIKTMELLIEKLAGEDDDGD